MGGGGGGGGGGAGTCRLAKNIVLGDCLNKSEVKYLYPYWVSYAEDDLTMLSRDMPTMYCLQNQSFVRNCMHMTFIHRFPPVHIHTDRPYNSQVGLTKKF